MVQGNRVHHMTVDMVAGEGGGQPRGFRPQEAESNDSWCSVHRYLSHGIRE